MIEAIGAARRSRETSEITCSEVSRHCLGIAADIELTDAFGQPLWLCQGMVFRGVAG